MDGHTKFAENAKMSDANLAKAKGVIDSAAATDYMQEAIGNAETIIKLLNNLWADIGLTAEQAIFALSLATVNFREQAPVSIGGKEMFDRVAHEAVKYYRENADK